MFTFSPPLHSSSSTTTTTMTSENTKFAAEIAEKYGPFLTKAMKDDGGVDDLQSLFASPVHVVLPSSTGDEVVFTIGKEDNASMTWEEFQKVSSVDLQDNYQKTESECIGVLGNRLILEVARINTDGEAYLVAYNLVGFNSEGKITDFEAFTDLKVTTLTG